MKKIKFNDALEYIVHCKEDGTIIGPISKVYAHSPEVRSSQTHYSTWSMIFHPSSGKYGIQLKNPKKPDALGAGKWDMGVAGHNCYTIDKGNYKPMSFNETLIKEADEEIGLAIEIIDSKEDFTKAAKNHLKNPIAFIFEHFLYKTPENNEFVGLAFILTPTTKLEFKDNEVVDFKWLTPGELSIFLKKRDDYCAPLLLSFNKAEIFRKSVL